jgi:hypothetical protein
MSASAASGRVITILLSTFNGAPFLAEQLDSFLAQTHRNWVLYWRDDGSADDTVRIMRGFARRIGADRCIESPGSGPHLGARASFLGLLAQARSAEIVAFADQDDVWLPDKLARAAAQIEPHGLHPALYCGRQYLVDEKLSGLGLSILHRGDAEFPASLTQNIAAGNTLVMNAAAVALVTSLGQPDVSMHDWWCYITLSAAGGAIMFDAQPQVLYRLHKTNLVGTARPAYARAWGALRRGPQRYMAAMRRHADALAAEPARLTPQARADLKLVEAALHGDLLARITALRCPRLRRRTRLETLLFGYWFLTVPPPPRGVAKAVQGLSAVELREVK